MKSQLKQMDYLRLIHTGTPRVDINKYDTKNLRKKI